MVCSQACVLHTWSTLSPGRTQIEVTQELLSSTSRLSLSPLPYQGHPTQPLSPLMFFSNCSTVSSCNPAIQPPVRPLSLGQPELFSVILILSQSCPHSCLALQIKLFFFFTYHLTNNHFHPPAQFLSLLKFNPQCLIQIDMLTDCNRMLTRKHDRQIPRSQFLWLYWFDLSNSEQQFQGKSRL